MSMFHELMMRKKEETMYATIKGSLTENDGVFSGFSASNYLQTQTEILANESFSGNVRAKINSGETGFSGLLFIEKDNKRFSIEFNTTTSIRTYCYDDTTSSNKPKTIYNVTSADTWFDFYFNFDSVAKTLYLSIRNTDGIEVGRIDYTDVSLNGGSIKYGYAWSGLNGSIDLNESYIKLGSTKYKLQAVVGYTVVGSPTITDGVVSGFSASDYVYIPSKDLLANDVFDFVVKFKLNSINKYYVLLGMAMTTPGGSAAYNGLRIQGNTNKLVFGRAVGGVGNVEGPNIALNANVDYWARVLQDGNNIRVGLSTNGIDYTYGDAYQKEDMLQTILYRWVIGGAVNLDINNFIDGSIDLNNTYVKINNKLWFNGQPA